VSLPTRPQKSNPDDSENSKNPDRNSIVETREIMTRGKKKRPLRSKKRQHCEKSQTAMTQSPQTVWFSIEKWKSCATCTKWHDLISSATSYKS